MTNQTKSDLEIRRDIELGQALDRLKQNDDFKTLVLDGYIKGTLLTESQHIISADPATRQMIIEEMLSVNYFRDYLAKVANSASTAQADLGEEDE